jgi:hypothetical protein
MKNCDYCGRENTDDAVHCRECGTRLIPEASASQTSKAATSDNPVRAAAEKRMIHGAIWCIGGIVVTAVSYASAASSPFGGTYIVAWGAIFFGGLRFFQGLSGRNATTNKSNTWDAAYEALTHGTKLETQGRVQEALAIYQAIIEKYPQSDASKDAKKSIENLQAKLG